MDYQAFGYRIRQLRKSLKITQSELAERANISASFLGHIERGSRVASLETLISLCNTLHVSPVFLLQDELEDTPFPMPDTIPAELKPKVRSLLFHAFELMKQ